MHTRILLGDFKGIDHLGYQGTGGIILKWMARKQDGRLWVVIFVCLDREK
jgi:hypothetical protein